ncbi:MAG: BamA/TamA family outer membrane protein, partial [Flavobacteriaceae bacterium]
MNKVFSIGVSLLFFCHFQANSQKMMDKKVTFMPMPIVMSNPTFGPSFGAMGAVMYKINSSDKVSPMSKTSFMGMYGLNKSYSWWLSQDLYFKQDLFRVNVNIGSFKIPVKYMYMDNQSLEYVEKDYFIRLKLLKKIRPYLYAGVYFNYTPQTFTEIINDTEDPNLQIENSTQSSIGLMATYDTRDYIYYPRKGNYSNLYLLTSQSFIGATDNFYSINYNAMKYISIKARDVIALRFNGSNYFGDVPYGALALYGVSSVDLSQVDLRGYMRGKYRGKNQIDLQAEYRYNFDQKHFRWGLVANAGIGRIWEADYQTTLYDSNKWLPSVGAGIRYNAIKKKHLNIRLDYGYGIKENHAVYLGLFEAF